MPAAYREEMADWLDGLEEDGRKTIALSHSLAVACKEMKKREEHIIARSTDIWESSVRATHSFLTADEIEGIKRYVPKLLREVEHLIVAEDEKGVPVAFAGIGGRKLEMLFVAASHIGEG